MRPDAVGVDLSGRVEQRDGAAFGRAKHRGLGIGHGFKHRQAHRDQADAWQECPELGNLRGRHE